MAQYRYGTVDVTSGSPIVVGHSTEWVANLSIGDLFAISGEGVWYEIESIQDNTHLTLTSNYTGTTKTESAYGVQRDFTPNNNYPTPAYGDSDVASLIAKALLEIDAQLAALSPLTSILQGEIVLDGNLTVVNESSAPFILTDLSSITIDLTASRDFELSIGGNRTIAINIAGQTGQRGFIAITQASVGGWNPTWSSNVITAGDAAITLTSGVGKLDIIEYVVLSATKIMLTPRYDVR
jgi:hypothetical protein